MAVSDERPPNGLGIEWRKTKNIYPHLRSKFVRVRGGRTLRGALCPPPWSDSECIQTSTTGREIVCVILNPLQFRIRSDHFSVDLKLPDYTPSPS